MPGETGDGRPVEELIYAISICIVSIWLTPF